MQGIVDEKKAAAKKKEEEAPKPEPGPAQKVEAVAEALLDSPLAESEPLDEEDTLKDKTVQWGSGGKKKQPSAKSASGFGQSRGRGKAQDRKNNKVGRSSRGQTTQGGVAHVSPRRSRSRSAGRSHLSTARTTIMPAKRALSLEAGGGESAMAAQTHSASSSSVKRRLSKKSAADLTDEEKATEWIEATRLSEILKTPKSWGNEFYAGKRIMNLLRKSAPHSAEMVMVTAHMERAQAASQLTPSKLMSLSKEERKRLLAIATSEGAEALEWPVSSQFMFVKVNLKEVMGEMRTSTSVEEWGERVWRLVQPIKDTEP